VILGNLAVVLGKFCVAYGTCGVCSCLVAVLLGSIVVFTFLPVMIFLRFPGGYGGFQVAASSGLMCVLRFGLRFVFSEALLGSSFVSFGGFRVVTTGVASRTGTF